MTAVTIVTICFNEEKNIARTIQSVLDQSATDYEYVICDGLSKDRTVEIAESYREKFAEKGISYRIYSEKDGGIYDAMNKGVGHAQGQYIYFLNAGDWFCGPDVLKHFTDAIQEDSSPAVYYGDFYFLVKHEAILIPCDDSKLMEYMSVGHPAMAARTALMRKTPFDTSFKIAADYNFVLGLKMANLPFRHLDVAAIYFLDGGISTVNAETNKMECYRIHESYGLPHKSVQPQAPSRITQLKEYLIKIAPTWLWRLYVTNIKHGLWVKY